MKPLPPESTLSASDQATVVPPPALPGAPTELSPDVAAPFAQRGIPFQSVDYTSKGYHLDASVEPGKVVSAAELLNQSGFSLDAITGVDWIAEDQIEVVYDYFHPTVNVRAVVRTRVPRGEPEVPSIVQVFPGANWHEREAHDFFGIRFAGHPHLIPILLPEDATFHPLRKDFVA